MVRFFKFFLLILKSSAAQCMSNAKYQGFKPEEPLRIDYNLVPHLIAAWKIPIREDSIKK